MKYKCTDCGQEFDIKPDFCDCGNNVFEEVQEETTPAHAPTPAPTPKVEPRIETPRTTRPTYRKPVDIPSVLIFLTCIVLSILSWIFIGRDAGKVDETTAEQPVIEKNTQIPSIDKIWNGKAPIVTAENPQPEPVAVKVVEVTKPATTTPAKTEPKKTVLSKQQTKQPAQTTKPTQQVAKPAVQQQQPSKTSTPSMTEKQKQAIIDKLTTKKEPSKTETKKNETQKVEQKKAEPQKIVEKQKQEAPKVQEVKAPDPAQLKKELDAYKISLRNKLGKSINFSAVIGDGKCAVTFKLDGTGNLTNRKFAVQSQNNSLNDAVYAAMMQNPTFKEPPAGYKGETLTLTVTMYGGNFEVGLK